MTMNSLCKLIIYSIVTAVPAMAGGTPAYALSDAYKDNIYETGILKPVDSVLKVKVGDRAPDFSLKSLSGKQIAIADYRGRKNVVLSFIPAAWTPVCSDQWPGYNIVWDIFDEHDAVMLGISVDSLPTLFSWTNQMGKLWFEVLSDFFPHGATAAKFGLLRSDGMTERALLVIDKQGIIRYIDIHDINRRPPLDVLIKELEKLSR
jgi:peroxiredoxin (alkyl hydroperoxide reductase subunit C)